MLPVKNVELTKVHYFEKSKHDRNVEVPTISREVSQNTFNKNLVIKKNIFGHKWVLRINEERDNNIKKHKNVRCILYCLVFSCILLAVSGGLFFALELDKKYFNGSDFEKDRNVVKIARSLDKVSGADMEKQVKSGRENFKFSSMDLGKHNETVLNNGENLKHNSSILENTNQRKYCSNCTKNHVCLKTEENSKPICAEIVDRHDPTGCGGLCIVNVEFCAVLDRQHMVYQCTPLKNLLRCPSDTFNCGEQCISRSKVCDGIVHCKDMQDERFCECKLEENFQCTNSTKCLPKTKRCDGIVDCWDRSDENGCHEECPLGQYACLDGHCIFKENFCDGIIHCSDSSDEPIGCLI